MNFIKPLSLLFVLACSSLNLNAQQQSAVSAEPAFKLEGKLSVLNPLNKPITSFEIEIADTKEERRQGLMFRHSLAENRGMLFLFEQEKELHFWMENTYIPLDIIYINSNKQIIYIAKNTEPLNRTILSSSGVAQYALEINAGLSDKWGFKVGDHIDFNYLK